MGFAALSSFHLFFPFGLTCAIEFQVDHVWTKTRLVSPFPPESHDTDDPPYTKRIVSRVNPPSRPLRADSRLFISEHERPWGEEVDFKHSSKRNSSPVQHVCIISLCLDDLCEDFPLEAVGNLVTLEQFHNGQLPVAIQNQNNNSQTMSHDNSSTP